CGESSGTTSATMSLPSRRSSDLNPLSQSISAGSNATFVAAASGNPTPTVQWQISTNGGATFSNIAGATSTTLLLTAEPVSDNGKQQQGMRMNSSHTATS